VSSKSQVAFVVIIAGSISALAIWPSCAPTISSNCPYLVSTVGPKYAVSLVAKETDAKPLEVFEIGTSGRPITVPVRLADCTLKFMVDTGAAKTAFDESVIDKLGLREILHTTLLHTPTGAIPTEVLKCPRAFVGEQSLHRIESIVCCDLEPIRRATGLDISGVIGMDFLVLFAVEIDFDKGVMQLYDKAPSHWEAFGVRVPLSIYQKCPVIDVQLPSVPSEQFVINTGADISSVSHAIFDRLCSTRALTPAAHQHGVSVGGMLRWQSGKVTNLTLGPFQHKGIRLDRGTLSTIGLGYLSRYLVRFDFANSLLSLAPGERFAKDESVATSVCLFHAWHCFSPVHYSVTMHKRLGIFSASCFRLVVR
jgi:hypothetical protein